MNESKEEFDNYLGSIEHFRKFPAMKPYIGKNFGNGIYPKILMVGESHYLPNNSTISSSPENWYNSKQKELTAEEVDWINTRKILSGDWKPRGHMIFRELNDRLKKLMTPSKVRAMNNVSFMNGFQRPAPAKGESIKNFCKPIDYDIGAQTIAKTVTILEPELVLFVSKLAWDKLGSKIPKPEFKTEFNFVCHPGTGGRYWHSKKYNHGVRKFEAIIKKVIN